ncbi:hypothetical protein [Nocardia carnea]|uniref:hypothetical protein n=1 Tax=Nocardia carnea TaxID=37328 RepID=UPI0024582782|nr:hypothetical protein [Nocardia carnea]
MTITLILFIAWITGFVSFLAFGALANSITFGATRWLEILAAAFLWPVLLPFGVFGAIARCRKPRADSGGLPVPPAYDPSAIYTLVTTLEGNGIDSTDKATDQILQTTANELGLPAPSANDRARIRNLIDQPAGVAIRIIHDRWRSTPLPVFDYHDLTSSRHESDETIAERQFKRFNRDECDIARDYRARGLRSLSVGDIVGIDDRYLQCDSVGWSPIPKPDFLP